MPVSETLVIGLLFFAGAALYASVGHGGASSYLAVMGLFSFAPTVMKPTALALNILVAAVATLKFFRATSGVAAPFILVNSIAGLLGHLSSVAQLPPNIPIWAAAAAIGGWIGASYGSRKAPAPVLRQLLSLVLIVAGAKLIFGS